MESSLWQWLKEKFLPVAHIVEDAFHNMDFSGLKFQLNRKNWHSSMFVKIFQDSADEEMSK